MAFFPFSDDQLCSTSKPPKNLILLKKNTQKIRNSTFHGLKSNVLNNEYIYIQLNVCNSSHKTISAETKIGLPAHDNIR